MYERDTQENERPKKKAPGTPIVTAGPIKPVGVPKDDIVRLATTGTLGERIDTGMRLQKQPEIANAVSREIKKAQAPGKAATLANVALSNVMAPISEKAASMATDRALDDYAEGGGDPSKDANKFAAAAAFGDVAGNLALSRIPTAKAAQTRLGNVGLRSAEGAAQAGGAGAVGGLAFGDEEGEAGLGAAYRQLLRNAPVGAALGGAMGGIRLKKPVSVRPDPVKPPTIANISNEQAVAINTGHQSIRNAPAGPVTVSMEAVGHIWDNPSRRAQLQGLGYENAEQFVKDVGEGFTEIYDTGPNSVGLVRHMPDGRAVWANVGGAEMPSWQVGSGAPLKPNRMKNKTRLWPPAPEGGPDATHVGSSLTATDPGFTPEGSGTTGAARLTETQPRISSLTKQEPGFKNRPGYLELGPTPREGDGVPFIAPLDQGKNPRLTNISKLGLSPEGEAVFREIMPEIGEKKTVSWEETKELARQLEMDPVGLRFNLNDWSGAEMLAARNVIAQNTERIVELSKIAKDGTLPPQEIEAATAEITRLSNDVGVLAGLASKQVSKTGRDLNAAKIIARRTMDPATWLVQGQRVKDEIPLTVDEQAEIVKLSKSLDRAGLINYISRLSKSSPWDQALTLWKAGLLTSPVTHVVNNVSNLSMTAMETAKEPIAAVADALIAAVRNERTPDGRLRLTKKPTARGLLVEPIRAMKTGAKAAGQQLRTGVDPRLAEKYDFRSTNYDNWFGSAFWNGYTRTVFNTLSAEDLLPRAMNVARSLEERLQLNINKLAEANDIDISTKPAREAYLAQLRKNPPDALMLEAISDAEYATFQSSNPVARGVRAFKNQLPGAGRATVDFIAPFVQTPTNVAARLVDYSPLGFVRIARVLSKELSEPAQKKLAEDLARSATGTGLVMMGYMLAKEGKATGAAPTQSASDDGGRALWEVENKQPNSVLVDGKWVNVSRLSPSGMLIALGAQMYNAAEQAQTKTGALASAAFTPARVALDQSFLQGVSGALSAANDPGRYGEKFAESTVRSVIPSGVAAVARGIDPVEREADTMTDQIKTRLPGLSKTLPARMTAFGDEMKREGGLAGALLNPLPYKTAKSTPLLEEMRRLGIAPSRPGRTYTDEKGNKVTRTPEEIREYLKTFGPLQRQYMELLINAPTYEKEYAQGTEPFGFTDNTRAKALKREQGRARKAATNAEKQKRVALR